MNNNLKQLIELQKIDSRLLTIEESNSLKKELQSHVKNITAPYKYPREIEFVTELPKTISGKIRRNLLRENELKKKSL